MFKIDASDCFALRQKLVHSYQEQGPDQEVIFKCNDGEQRCSRFVLNAVSDFYTDQLAGRDRMDNEPHFNYDFAKVTIKAFLDLAHGISIDEMDLVTLLELIKFVSFEGKKDSEFEGKLLTKLRMELKQAKFSLDSKLLISLISNTFDNFNGELDKTFFETHTDKEISECVFNLDLESEPNKHLAKMISSEESQQANDEIGSQVYLLVMKLKRNKITKQIQQTPTQATKPTAIESTESVPASPMVNSKRIVKIGYEPGKFFDLNVDTSNTVHGLIYQVNAKLKEKRYYIPYGNAAQLEYKGATMEGDLAKCNLKDGDRIRYFFKIKTTIPL